MKKKITSIAIILFSIIVASEVFANSIKGSGPEFINLKMGATQLQFLHWKHQSSNDKDCLNCHKVEGGKIEGWGKEAAHELCIPCHDMNDKGPVACKECHK